MPAAVHPNSFKARKTLAVGSKSYTYWSLKAVEKEVGDLSRLPFSLRILMENLVRYEDGTTVKKEDIAAFADWVKNGGKSTKEINFRCARVLMQDFTGVPAVVDLAAMRDAMQKLGGEGQEDESAGSGRTCRRSTDSVDHQVDRAASGLIFLASPPSFCMASRIAARSTTAGTPVKSCISTRAQRKLISLIDLPPFFTQSAKAAISVLLDRGAVLVTDQVLHQDAQREGQAGEVADFFFDRLQAPVGVGLGCRPSASCGP